MTVLKISYTWHLSDHIYHDMYINTDILGTFFAADRNTMSSATKLYSNEIKKYTTEHKPELSNGIVYTFYASIIFTIICNKKIMQTSEIPSQN